MDFVLWNEETFSEKLLSGIRSWIKRIAAKTKRGKGIAGAGAD